MSVHHPLMKTLHTLIVSKDFMKLGMACMHNRRQGARHRKQSIGYILCGTTWVKGGTPSPSKLHNHLYQHLMAVGRGGGALAPQRILRMTSAIILYCKSIIMMRLQYSDLWKINQLIKFEPPNPKKLSICFHTLTYSCCHQSSNLPAQQL